MVSLSVIWLLLYCDAANNGNRCMIDKAPVSDYREETQESEGWRPVQVFLSRSDCQRWIFNRPFAFLHSLDPRVERKMQSQSRLTFDKNGRLYLPDSRWVECRRVKLADESSH